MKCSNADCKRGLGLLTYRRGWFGKRGYCSNHCRYAVVAHEPKRQQELIATTYVEWLFLHPTESHQLKLNPALIRTRAR